jgi:hypothetical protein
VAPWHGVHKGRDELPHFFAAIGENCEVTEFTPLAFGTNNTDVFTRVTVGVTVPAKNGTMAPFPLVPLPRRQDLVLHRHRRYQHDPRAAHAVRR